MVARPRRRRAPRRWCRRCPRRPARWRAGRVRRRPLGQRCRRGWPGRRSRAACRVECRAVAARASGPRRTRRGSRLSVHQRSTAVSRAVDRAPAGAHGEVLGDVEQVAGGARRRRAVRGAATGSGRPGPGRCGWARRRCWRPRCAAGGRRSRCRAARDRAAGDVPGVGGAARVHPDERGVGGSPVRVDGHGAAPLAGEAEGLTRSALPGCAVEQFPDGRRRSACHQSSRVLLGAAAGQHPGGQVAFGHGEEVTAGGGQRGAHRAAGAQVDADDELGPAGFRCRVRPPGSGRRTSRVVIRPRGSSRRRVRSAARASSMTSSVSAIEV